MKALTWSGVFVRFIVAFSLVTLTWNPSPYNFIRWAINNWQEMTPFVLFSGIVLTITWVVFVRAGARSLGFIGSVLAVALAGSILWMVIDFEFIDPSNTTTLTWVVLTLFAAILTAGMSWSHLRRRWSGQIDIDDVDNG
ncbi:MAG: DUF6524 family protein [Gammaproteobacteria bacterium]|jgi:hypothetical protein